jgi:hypothetical protein
MQAVEQLATIHIYQINDDTNDSIALALYPTAAWADSTLEAAIEAALTAGGVSNNVTVTTGATFAG